MKILHKSKSGSTYVIDLENLSCTCPHYMYRLSKSGGICKHIQFELDKYKDQMENAKIFLKNNDDAVLFVETFNEELLNLMKSKGDVYEKRGKLINLG